MKADSRLNEKVEGSRYFFYRTRGQMVVRLNRRRGGEDGIYHCEIPDSVNVIQCDSASTNQTIYIEVYTVYNSSTGEI